MPVGHVCIHFCVFFNVVVHLCWVTDRQSLTYNFAYSQIAAVPRLHADSGWYMEQISQCFFAKRCWLKNLLKKCG